MLHLCAMFSTWYVWLLIEKEKSYGIVGYKFLALTDTLLMGNKNSNINQAH